MTVLTGERVLAVGVVWDLYFKWNLSGYLRAVVWDLYFKWNLSGYLRAVAYFYAYIKSF